MQLSPGLLTLVISASSTLCSAQAFNIDAGGTFGDILPAEYGAASGQAGYWNTTGITSKALLDLQGNPTDVIYSTESSGILDLDIEGASEYDKLLMGSALGVSPTAAAGVFWNLAPGMYDVYVYCWAGNLLGTKDVTIRAFTGAGQVVGGVTYAESWPGGHGLGVTYDRLRVEVTQGGNQYLSIFIQAPGDFNVINGIQLVPVPAPASAALPILSALLIARRRR